MGDAKRRKQLNLDAGLPKGDSAYHRKRAAEQEKRQRAEEIKAQNKLFNDFIERAESLTWQDGTPEDALDWLKEHQQFSQLPGMRERFISPESALVVYVRGGRDVDRFEELLDQIPVDQIMAVAPNGIECCHV